MIQRSISLVVIASVFTACGPLSRTTENKPAHKAQAAADSSVIVAQSGGDKAAYAPTYDAPKGKDSAVATDEPSTPTQSPSQTPTQSPHQSPNQSPTPSPPLTISAIRYSGDACPTGTVAANLSPDSKAFTLLFDAFSLDTPMPSAGLVVTKACNVELDLTSAEGWQLTLLTVDERGFATLNSGDEATLTTGFAFAAAAPHAVVASKLAGPLDENFQKRAEADLVTAPWSGCQATKTLHLDVAVALKLAGAAEALLSVDSVDGELHHKAGLAFRRCH